ncbi:MAG: serine hydrolase domain-containing protein [Ignavibacteriaceae bacterium]
MHFLIEKNMKLFFLFLLSFCLFPIAADSQVKFPDTPAGKRGQQILDLLNGEIKIEPKEFVNQNCSDSFKNSIPENQWGGLLKQLISMSPGFELVKINKSDEYEIEFVIQLKSNNMFMTVNTLVEKLSPNLISGMRFVPGGSSQSGMKSQVKPDPGQTAENVEHIKDYISKLSAQNKFSGSVIVAKEGKILLHQTAGYANKRFKVFNEADTKFNLGSLNKSFTTVAILQLVEKGKIGIDDPVGNYLDFFPKDIAEKVTIRQLLDMSSGWGDYWDNKYYLQHKDELRTVNQYMEFIKNIPLDFEPGSHMQHSNIGFEVLGAVIEKVSKMDYFNYIREDIYKPAGMINSDSYNRDSPVKNLATGYTNNNVMDTINTGWEWENTYILSPRETPAGGGYSTTEDMLNYDNALRNGKLIGEAYLNFMDKRFKGNIGDSLIPTRVLRSAGGAPGVSTFFARDMKNGFTIIVLSNYDHPVAIDVGNEIINLLGLE